ncbi:ADP-ribosylation factor [Blastocladiella britannica]|nr:ADP-ribosylation factor [Blastocladiella britannica]
MGDLASTLGIGKHQQQQKKRILVVGLSGAGKSTVLFKLRLGDIETITTPNGVRVDTVTHKNLEFVVWDLDVQSRLTAEEYRQYTENAQGIIFVVDSADRTRIHEARAELYRLFEADDELRDTPLLVLANKQDDQHAMATAEVAESLDLMGLIKYNIKWWTQAAAGRSGDGLFEGLQWLSTLL